ncbi:MAG TPA: hypothetical protein VGM84_01565 [Steroidobacteraceae bacterium]|jgi:hypothetical protein
MTSIPLRRTDAETSWQRVTNWLALLILLALGFVWGPSGAAEAGAATPDVPAASPDIADVRAGSLYLRSSSGEAPTAAVRQSASIHAHVTGNVARVYVSQTFTTFISQRDQVQERMGGLVSQAAALALGRHQADWEADRPRP